jgi:hypothetical protein
MNDEPPPPVTHVHLPPQHQRSHGETAVLVFLALSMIVTLWFVLWVWDTTSPEPMAIAPVIAAVTPIDAQGRAKMAIQVSVVINWPTVAPRATTFVYSTMTPIPFCPGYNGQVCMVPAPIKTETPVPLQTCDSKTLPGLTPGELCTWRDMPTATPERQEGFWK